ncbi:ATPase [Ahniella affigens]|uniref:ATPase n=1 Tax=Ahniella affigens TaxID=2021234 RepID=A0A2P1PRJ7_9GAMM|nr:SRPBCC domain-containing protein [Ahniella affigens]AVP97448.1 ATPase [Ahniella affigens]
MSQNLMFDVTVDKAAQTVLITRQFAAELALVWEAFTTPDVLDQWWAPKPFQARSKVMEFRVGGRRFYAMVSPDGSERWAIQRYTEIVPMERIKFFNVFADADENPDATGSNWDLTFSEQDGITTVRILVHNESLARMEHLLEGFKLGFTAALDSLDDLLRRQSDR